MAASGGNARTATTRCTFATTRRSRSNAVAAAPPTADRALRTETVDPSAHACAATIPTVLASSGDSRRGLPGPVTVAASALTKLATNTARIKPLIARKPAEGLSLQPARGEQRRRAPTDAPHCPSHDRGEPRPAEHDAHDDEHERGADREHGGVRRAVQRRRQRDCEQHERSCERHHAARCRSLVADVPGDAERRDANPAQRDDRRDPRERGHAERASAPPIRARDAGRPDRTSARRTGCARRRAAR